MESLHDTIEERDYEQLKDLMPDRSRWRSHKVACEKPAGNSRRLKKLHIILTY